MIGERARPYSATAEAIVPFSHTTPSMGGRLSIHLDADPNRSAEAERACLMAVGRIDTWATRLTRHSDDSDLSRLNADPRGDVPVRPTLAAALRAGRAVMLQSEGLADITLLDARLAAEGLIAERPAAQAAGWSLEPGRLGSAIVRRPPGLHFDLGGIGKGWIADRALQLLEAWPSAVVDADGDLAIRCAPGKQWDVAVDDPRTPDTTLAVLKLGATAGSPTRFGVATSGTSVHRWTLAGRTGHHLIDPRTGRPAVTDVIQATVIAGSALRAEALAKAAVIAGAAGGFALLERARVLGAVLLTDRGETLALPQTLPLLGD